VFAINLVTLYHPQMINQVKNTDYYSKMSINVRFLINQFIGKFPFILNSQNQF